MGTMLLPALSNHIHIIIYDGFNDESFRQKEYTFNLEKSKNKWLITDVTTNASICEKYR